jgi:hypothetical protein
MRSTARRRRGRLLPLLAMLSVVVAPLVTQSGLARAGTIETCVVKNRTSGQSYPPSDGTTLQLAIDEADEGDVLEVRGRCLGGFSIDKPLTLVGEPARGFPVATLDGDRTTGVLEVLSAPVTLRNILVTRGSRAPEAGGILNAGTLTLTSSLVIDNEGSQWGGGIYNQGTLTLKGDSRVNGNVAGTDGGGGIYNVNGDVELRGSSHVSRNRTQNVGGGIYNGGGTVVLRRSSRVSQNVSRNSGGGIYNGGRIELNGSARVVRNFAGLNQGSAAGGGGIANEQGVLTLNDESRVNKNAAPFGGGVCNTGSSLAELLIMNDHSQISRNTARNGGGICNRAATVTMNGSSRVRGNTASRDGGGIWDVDGAITMAGSASIFRNTAEGGTPGSPTGRGGGIRICGTTLTGVTDGVNVFNNAPDNINGCP